jgi:hypothetical protein
VSNLNANPTKARQAKKRKNKPGNLQDVLGIVWDALQTAQKILESEDPVMQLKAAHGCFQGGMAYAKLYESGELEARLLALEQALPGPSNVSRLDAA